MNSRNRSSFEPACLKRGFVKRTLVALSVSVVLSHSALAAAQTRARHFNIHAQALAAALSEFARQSDRQLLFSTDIVDSKRAVAIKGELEPEEALRLLLEGTGLTFQVTSDETILVQSLSQGRSAEIGIAQQFMRVAHAGAGAASGQSAAAQDSSGETGSSSSRATESDDEDAEREEVVVKAFRARTATKTDVALTETPQAISIITADEIASRGAPGLQEALRYSAGVRTELNGSDLRFDYFFSRGFRATDFLDGMVRPDNYNTARTEVYTLERVEVLRGPSSVLYGQGAAGGVVNSMTKRPRNEFAAEAGVEYGSYDRKQAQFDITGPLMGSNIVSGRLVGVFREADNQFDFGRDDRIVIAPSLRIQPNDQTDLVFLGLYQEDKAGSVFPYLPVQATLHAPPGRRLPDELFLGEPDLNIFDREQTSGSVLLQHRFSDNVTFDGGVRYIDASGYDAGIYGDIWNGVENPFIDPDMSLLPRYRFDWKVRTAVLTTDNRVQWRFGTGNFEHNILTGVDYTHTDYDSASAFVSGAPPLNVYSPVYGNGIDAPLSPFSEQIAKQLGFYLQDHIRIGERATFVLGARRDRVRTSLTDTDDQVDKATTFRAGLTYEVIEGVTPYASYAESFFPTLGVDFYGNSFKPQRGIQYEAGVKWQPDRDTLLSVAAFNLKGTNKPETDPENGNNVIQRGEVESEGVELEAVRRLPNDYSVSFAYSYADVQVSKSVEPLEIGFPVSGVPKEQISFWGEKTIALGSERLARIGLGVRRIGSTEEALLMSPTQIDRLKSPGFTLADALVALDWNQSTFSVGATNLLDERYYGSCSIRTACSIGYRRNLVARWTYRF